MPSNSVRREFALRATAATASSLGQSLFRLAQSYHALGEYRQAISLLEQGLEFNANELRHDRHNLNIIPSVLNRTWLAIALVECGDFSAGMRHARRALEIAEGAEHQLSELLGWLSIGYVLSHKGEIEGAVGALERGLGPERSLVVPSLAHSPRV